MIKTQNSQPKALLSYRANDVYTPSTMRAVEQGLRFGGTRLDTVSFPKGTEPDVVSRGVRERTQDLLKEGTIVIADRTTIGQYEEMDKKIYLDYLATEAALATLPENLKVEESLTLEDEEKVFKLLMTEAIKELKPDVIYISTPHLADHGAFWDFEGQDADFVNLPLSYFDSSIDPRSKTKVNDYKEAKIIKKWLAEIGFEGDIIIYENLIGSVLKEELTLAQLQKQYPDTWMDKLGEFNEASQSNLLVQGKKSIVLVDRHYGGTKTTGATNETLLKLPLSNLVEELIRKGIIKGDQAKFVPKLIELIKKEIQDLTKS